MRFFVCTTKAERRHTHTHTHTECTHTTLGIAMERNNLFENVLYRMRLSKLNRLRIRMIATGLPQQLLPRPIFLLVIGSLFTFCAAYLPWKHVRNRKRNLIQQRVDERKLREGTFVLEMLQWYGEEERKSLPVHALFHYTTMQQFLHERDSEKKGEPLPDFEEDIINVERWPIRNEQRHSLYYREKVRKKIEKLQKEIEQLEKELS